ncbi:MAG: CarD family transcriptional regulator [Hyphomicrobium sp.]
MKKTATVASAVKKSVTKSVAPSQAATAPVATAKPAGVKPAAAKPQAIAAPLAQRPTASTAAVVASVAAHQAAAPARVAAALAKSSGQKITAPAPAQPATPKAIAEKAAAARQMIAAAAAAQKKPVSQRHGFKTSEFIVYPAHGVGRIVGIEEQEIAGMSLELFVITFDKEKLTLRVPTGKLESVGMRKLADENVVKKAMETLKGRARVKRTMWSRRAQEYVAKINSGDLVSIAEVVRDLYRSEAQPEQSYSERQLYEDALDRMAREIAAVDKLDERGAVQRITDVLSKSARGRRLADGTEGEIKAA